jgi:hypothetical protein
VFSGGLVPGVTEGGPLETSAFCENPLVLAEYLWNIQISSPALHAVLSMKLPGPFLLSGLLLVGCSTLNTHFAPNANVGQLKHIYVQQSLNDNHGLDILIVKQLQARGIQAESGPLTLMPRDVKAYLVYEDRWDWDFKDYLIGLGVTVRDATSDHLLATSRYFRPTAFLKSPAFMVQSVLEGLFNPTAKSNQPRAADLPTEGSEKRGGRRN